MKKVIALLLAVSCMLALVGCAHQTEEPTSPTGYPSGEIQQPQIMYDGLLYFYFATGFDEPLPEGYDYVGDVEEVDNENAPQYDFQGSRVELRQEIYVLPGIHDTIYVKYENGYARFTLKKETENQFEPDAAVIPTCKSIEEAIADDFIDPSTVSVLSGEWAYTVDPNRFVALVSVNYMNKFDEYETAEYVVVGAFGGDAGTRHCLNQHSPYTRENVLQTFGAIDDKQFALFQYAEPMREKETIQFHDQTLNKSDLSEDTLEWLEWYNGLTETEQLSISYIPNDLYKLCGFDGIEDAPAVETEKNN